MPRRRPRPVSELSSLKILKHIGTLQLAYYLIAGILIAFTTLVAGHKVDLGTVLDWHNVRSDVTTGWTLGLCWMLTSLITVIPILVLIARSKLVPDFALTIHFIHLIITSLYARAIPTHLYWWTVQGFSAALMIALGMFACQYRELAPISFGGKGKAKVAIANADVDEEAKGEGFITGNESGRGRGGAGSYEMVGMASRDTG